MVQKLILSITENIKTFKIAHVVLKSKFKRFPKNFVIFAS